MEDSFGAHLRKLREAKRLSRNGLRDRVVARFGADMALSTDQLGNWEDDGTADPGAAKLACIVEVLEADYEDVFRRLVNRPAGGEDGPVPGDAPEGMPPGPDRPPRRRGGR